MLTMPALPTRFALEDASVIHTHRGGGLRVDRLSIDPGTMAEVVGLGVMFIAFLAGVFTLGTFM